MPLAMTGRNPPSQSTYVVAREGRYKPQDYAVISLWDNLCDYCQAECGATSPDSFKDGKDTSPVPANVAVPEQAAARLPSRLETFVELGQGMAQGEDPVDPCHAREFANPESMMKTTAPAPAPAATTAGTHTSNKESMNIMPPLSRSPSSITAIEEDGFGHPDHLSSSGEFKADKAVDARPRRRTKARCCDGPPPGFPMISTLRSSRDNAKLGMTIDKCSAFTDGTVFFAPLDRQVSASALGHDDSALGNSMRSISDISACRRCERCLIQMLDDDTGDEDDGDGDGEQQGELCAEGYVYNFSTDDETKEKPLDHGVHSEDSSDEELYEAYASQVSVAPFHPSCVSAASMQSVQSGPPGLVPSSLARENATTATMSPTLVAAAMHMSERSWSPLDPSPLSVAVHTVSEPSISPPTLSSGPLAQAAVNPPTPLEQRMTSLEKACHDLVSPQSWKRMRTTTSPMMVNQHQRQYPQAPPSPPPSAFSPKSAIYGTPQNLSHRDTSINHISPFPSSSPIGTPGQYHKFQHQNHQNQQYQQHQHIQHPNFGDMHLDRKAVSPPPPSQSLLRSCVSQCQHSPNVHPFQQQQQISTFSRFGAMKDTGAMAISDKCRNSIQKGHVQAHAHRAQCPSFDAMFSSERGGIATVPEQHSTSVLGMAFIPDVPVRQWL